MVTVGRKQAVVLSCLLPELFVFGMFASLQFDLGRGT
jgi:hypothetical protein